MLKLIRHSQESGPFPDPFWCKMYNFTVSFSVVIAFLFQIVCIPY